MNVSTLTDPELENLANEVDFELRTRALARKKRENARQKSVEPYPDNSEIQYDPTD